MLLCPTGHPGRCRSRCTEVPLPTGTLVLWHQPPWKLHSQHGPGRATVRPLVTSPPRAGQRGGGRRDSASVPAAPHGHLGHSSRVPNPSPMAPRPPEPPEAVQGWGVIPYFGNFLEQNQPLERATASWSPQQRGLNITRSERAPPGAIHPFPAALPFNLKITRLSGKAEPEPHRERAGTTGIGGDGGIDPPGPGGGTARAGASHRGEGIRRCQPTEAHGNPGGHPPVRKRMGRGTTTLLPRSHKTANDGRGGGGPNPTRNRGEHP